MSRIRPIGKRALIKRLRAATSKGGLFIPESAREKPTQGEVISVGNGEINRNGKLEKPILKAGDRVLFSSYSGTEVKMDHSSDDEYMIMSESDILCVIEGE